MNNIELKSIRSLSGMNFFIPDYQRGYRWASEQVEQMLDDFKEFCKRIDKKDVERGEFYCLQPIVVKPKTWENIVNGETRIIEGYEVIDGQQRLTTLYIILKKLEDARRFMFKKFSLYTINYETRLEYNSQAFLESINDSNQDANEFIDFYYMKNVYQAVERWFDKQDDIDANICQVLLNQSMDETANVDIANNVRVIWYEVLDQESASSIDIFTRLNIGKIPLTNAELIKALLLRKGNFAEKESTMRQLQIAAEWNHIEQTLQDDSFWYFLYRTDHPFTYENRIEFIFDLMKDRNKDSEFYHTFNEFNKDLELLQIDRSTYYNDQLRIDHIWSGVKKVFQTFEEWFEDRQLYHYIGFLIEYGMDIKALIEASLSKDKSDFLDYIKTLIKEKLKGVNLDDLSFNDSKGNIKKVLLLFNILTALKDKKSDMRFPFNKYKTEKWDIEHICSQTDKTISDDKQRLVWINDMLDYFVGDNDDDSVLSHIETLKEQIATEMESEGIQSKDKVVSLTNALRMVKSVYQLRQEKINATEFDEVFNTIQKYFGEDKEKIADKDSISNLTLLDQETNRSYGNAFFPIKRKRIIANDKLGVFVPIATKNVFLKYYSQHSTNLMHWQESDAAEYLESMKVMLNDFIDD